MTRQVDRAAEIDVYRVSIPTPVSLYAVETRNPSGEWRTFGEYADDEEACVVVHRLRQLGTDARIEVVRRPPPMHGGERWRRRRNGLPDCRSLRCDSTHSRTRAAPLPEAFTNAAKASSKE